jgi:cell wall-associated NlpC family hydrolase
MASAAEIDLLVKCAFKWVGTPYRWGGDDPSGIDCSGLVQECLESVGKNPPGGDKTADGIYRAVSIYRGNGVPRKGALLFFGSVDRITHIAIAIDKRFMIEAGGGGSKVHSTQDAWAANAWVRVRPISTRKDFVDCLFL